MKKLLTSVPLRPITPVAPGRLPRPAAGYDD
jgi:hypothetical protein